MQYPFPRTQVATPEQTIALDASVQDVVNAINAKTVIPYGDFGGPSVYYFQTMSNGLANLIYTVFDRNTSLGLASFMVRYGSAATIRQVMFEPFPRSQVTLQFMLLPKIPMSNVTQGTIIG